MTVGDWAEQLGLTVRAGGSGLGREVAGCHVGDLLSDALALAEEGWVWVTRQGHKAVAAVARLKGLAGVVVAQEAEVADETVAYCEAEGLPLLTTGLSAYEVAGLTFALLRGGQGLGTDKEPERGLNKHISDR